MNNMGISTDPGLLSVDLPASLTASPSVSTFLPEEEASICPLLPNTPSPPPMAFSHPLTPSADNDSNESVNCEDTKAETSSSGSSSGIGMDVTDAAATTLFNKHAYQHLGKNVDVNMQENGIKGHGTLNIPINKETPSFVSWNWPLIRKGTFMVFMSGLLAMCASVAAMIVMLPKSCDPRNSWHRGSVFYEIFPASFQDSNNDGLGDLRGIANRVTYLESLGIGAIRLNSIFPSNHYPDHFPNITSLVEIDEVLGTVNDLTILINALHERNMSLILDLPIYPYLKQLDETEIANKSDHNDTFNQNSLFSSNENLVTQAMRLWLSKGVDGFYIQGLEQFYNDPYLLENVEEWKYTLGSDRILIVNQKLFNNLDDSTSKKVLQFVDLVDVYLNVSNGTQYIHEQVTNILSGILSPLENTAWIQWTLGGVTEQRLSQGLSPNKTLAATIMQLMLPGTPSIFYGDEISLEESHDPHNDHINNKHLHHLSTMVWNGPYQFTNLETLPWIPRGASVSFNNFDDISKMVQLRDQYPSIYENAILKEGKIISNTNIRHSRNDILIIERWYPRRNTFVAISNFGNKTVSMDLTAMFYSGQVMVGRTRTEKVYFNEFEIGPMESIVVKLDK